MLPLDLGSGHIPQACGALDAGALSGGERAWPAIGHTLDARAQCCTRLIFSLPTAKRLGVVDHMRFHDLRHTYASLMLAAGFSPFEVSRYLGHASVEMVGKVHGHLYPTDSAAVTDKFERYASQARAESSSR